jgi:hypothetical protein
LRAADDEILVADRVDFFRLEPVAAAEDAEHREVAGPVAAEQEIRADPHLADVQPVDQHVADEGFRIPVRQLGREADDRRALHAGVGNRFELLRRRHQERRRLVRADDARRVRVEGHHHRRRSALAGDTADPLEDLAMPAMDAVEVAQRQHRLPPVRRPRVFRKMDDVHQMVKTRPS